jgi:hypothetical protein
MGQDQYINHRRTVSLSNRRWMVAT